MYLADMILRNLHLLPYFAAVQTSDDVKNGKPDPEIYLKAMGRLGVPPAECVVLEDSSNGALAGKRSGAYTIAVPSKYTRDQDFSSVDYVAENLLDAARHIAEKF
jgi:beta-phosphoglucomutase-like phosphatase (HAD superfamily)